MLFWVLSLPSGGLAEWQMLERERASERVVERERRRSVYKGLSLMEGVERSER